MSELQALGDHSDHSMTVSPNGEERGKNGLPQEQYHQQ